MATIALVHDAAVDSVTITLASLGNNNSRESTKIDFTAEVWENAAVQLVIETGTVSGTPEVDLWFWSSLDASSPIYPDGITGSDAAYTLISSPNLHRLFTLSAVANSTIYETPSIYIADAAYLLGGKLPATGGFVVTNRTGAAFSATGGNNYIKIRGVYRTVS